MKKVTILSDGRPGHFNQTLGIAEQLENAEIWVITISFKTALFDLFIRILGFIYNYIPFSNSIIKFVFKISLDKQSYKKIININPDLILSAGSSVAAINLMLSKLKRAKSVVCMTPSFTGTAPFDLAVVPRHDLPAERDNIIKTIGAPNRINKKFVKSEIEKWNKELEFDIFSLKKPVISIFLGGSDSYFNMKEETISSLIVEVEEFIEKYEGQILITTSLRTPERVEEYLCKKMSHNDNCPLLVIADQWDENPIPMMIGVSDIIIVTIDSVSMISEAVSGNNKVIVVGLETKGKKKLPRFFNVSKLLKEKGYIDLFDHKKLGNGDFTILMEGLYSNNQQKPLLNDAYNVAKEIEKRLF